jgi:deoxyribonucleoside regulator
MDDVKSKSSPDGVIKAFAAKLRAKRAYTLSVPVIVENKIIASTLLYDKRIEQTMNCINNCNKFIVNIALPNEDSCLYNLGYINDADLERLRKKGAVGNICCRFFNKHGEICDEDLDQRTISASIDQIKRADCVMACLSGGSKKAEATYYALRSGLLNVVVLDSVMAGKVLELACADAKE